MARVTNHIRNLRQPWRFFRVSSSGVPGFPLPEFTDWFPADVAPEPGMSSGLNVIRLDDVAPEDSPSVEVTAVSWGFSSGSPE